MIPKPAWIALLVVCTGCSKTSTPSVPDEAISACLRGIASIREAPLENRSDIVAQACKDLFAEKGCRDAWASTDRFAPDRKAAQLVEACRAAYCPLLEEPRPKLCAMKELPEPTSLRLHWAELMARILDRDLGAARAKQLQPVLMGLATTYQVIEVRP